jgi:hypothetical protein
MTAPHTRRGAAARAQKLRRAAARIAMVALCAAAAACQAPLDAAPASMGADASADTAPPAELCGDQPLVLPGGPLDTQGDLIALLNALPRPLTLPCFIASLPRPIGIQGDISLISLQPAVGKDNPRIFLRNGGMILSIALAGDQGTHIETAEPEQTGYSVKGDLGFPVTDPVVERNFFEGIRYSNGTVCGACHSDEHLARVVDTIPAFASHAYKPSASQMLPLSSVRALADGCDPADTGLRCQMLRGLFYRPDAVTTMQFLDGTTTFGSP